MARIRTIKPEYWTDERVGECSIPARLLFIAAWNFADDHGGLDRSPKQLKAQAFPYDAIDCEPLVQELLSQRLLIEYEVSGKKYLHIRGFRKHQKNEKPAAPRFPVYRDGTDGASGAPATSSGTTDTSSGGTDSSGGSSARSSGSSSSSLEGKIKEGKKNTERAAQQPEPGEFVEIRKAYPKRTGSHRWHDALGAFRARVTEGVDPKAMLAGVQRYAEFIRGTGKEGTEYVQQAATFLGKNRSFEQPWKPPPKPETAHDRMHRMLNGTDETRVIEYEREPFEPKKLPGH